MTTTALKFFSEDSRRCVALISGSRKLEQLSGGLRLVYFHFVGRKWGQTPPSRTRGGHLLQPCCDPPFLDGGSLH
ncbi:hypothetical protein HYDPIDRAFT_113868 [Hydnomerulius pinastri MD-312]|uniref:Uncharacterized protein n=1 Tax=Hydnomerulius pinastri MD-312 TaxID=994086 RepID=A0A0C9WD63_9AGAM|nr:hypothetical protein HYDPIDRAFT_113868 [Hydnomerulius pinastri MD-312]